MPVEDEGGANKDSQILSLHVASVPPYGMQVFPGFSPTRQKLSRMDTTPCTMRHRLGGGALSHAGRVRPAIRYPIKGCAAAGGDRQSLRPLHSRGKVNRIIIDAEECNAIRAPSTLLRTQSVARRLGFPVSVLRHEAGNRTASSAASAAYRSRPILPAPRARRSSHRKHFRRELNTGGSRFAYNGAVLRTQLDVRRQSLHSGIYLSKIEMNGLLHAGPDER